MKLLIGIPTSGQPTRPFLDALALLRMPPSVSNADRVVWSGNFVAVQREMIVRDALARGADTIVMIDDDIVAPPDALERLARALEDEPQAAIAAALYYSRDSARPMVVSRWSSTDTTSAVIPPFSAGTVSRVDGVGFGFVMMRAAALAQLSQPIFAAHAFVDDKHRVVRQCNEDYLLCERVRAAGWHVLLHGGVRVGHFDRATGTTAPDRWETDAESDRTRMFVREGDAVKMVPFDERVDRARERQERFDVRILSGSN